jgi:hypothetical protein
MKINLIIILIFLIVAGCGNNKEKENIEVINDQFDEILQNFIKNSSEFIPTVSNHIYSVSISVNSRDTIVGLYAYKKLRPEYYIGFFNLNADTIFFYSDNMEVDGFYKLKMPIEKIDYPLDYSDTYEEYYVYTCRNEKYIFEAMTR